MTTSGAAPEREARKAAHVRRLSAALMAPDLERAAREGGLRYIPPCGPGIRRRRAGKAFAYLDAEGRPIRAATVLARIRSLGIPPAWTAVWICPDPRGHIQAIGRDARGRKQYRYHPEWSRTRSETKFGRMLEFGRALPAIRRRVRRDLARRGLPREKVLALVVSLLEQTLIRIGNREYVKANRSFGLTTLRDEHVAIEGAKVRFEFRGKSGKTHSIAIRDRRLARLVRQCRDIPGQELFQYVIGERERRHPIASGDVNDYLREISGRDFTAKDFRTWGGTVNTALVLSEMGPCRTKGERKRRIIDAIKQVASRLGNTPAICKRYYVHASVLEAYERGSLLAALAGQANRRVREMRSEELALLELLGDRPRSEDRRKPILARHSA